MGSAGLVLIGYELGVRRLSLRTSFESLSKSVGDISVAAYLLERITSNGMRVG